MIGLCGLVLFGVSLRAERIYVVYDQSVTWIDPETGNLGNGIGGGVNYDVAISADRRVLYHLAGEALALRDPQTFDSVQTSDTTFAVPHRLRWTLPVKSSIALAPSGYFVYLLKLYSSQRQEDVAVSTFDAMNKRFLPQEGHLSECQGATLMPLHEDRQLLAVCGGDSVLHFLEIGNDGSIANDFVLQVPPLPIKTIPGPRVGRNDRQESFVQSALTPDGSTVLLAKGDGRITKIDVALRLVTASAISPPLANTRIMSSAPCISPDGTLWYLAARKQTNYGEENEQILAIDTQTLTLRLAITPHQPFRAMAISPDGRRLYTTEREPAIIHVLSTATGEEIHTLGGQGPAGVARNAPIFLVVAP